jgi:hypothetical protein
MQRDSWEFEIWAPLANAETWESCCFFLVVFKNDAVVKLFPSDERPQAAWDSVSRLAFTVVVAEAQGSFEVEGSCLLDLVRNWVDLEAVQSEHTKASI